MGETIEWAIKFYREMKECIFESIFRREDVKKIYPPR
jgi:hypothetical protein